MMRKKLSVLLVAAIVLSLGLPVSAAADVRTAVLTYREIQIAVNGSRLIPCDADGRETEPFILDGTTYLPVRAVANALGLSVEWDGDTSTVALTSGAEPDYGTGRPTLSKRTESAKLTYRGITVTLNDDPLVLTDADGREVKPFILDGTTYLPVRAIAQALGVPVEWEESTNTVYLGSRNQPQSVPTSVI